jgi:glucose-6-phosphate isomerase|tara:strand:+ start:36 stop:1205 length:1170 start_codon:yes stop_codon:yes gene_type:complete
MISTKNLKFFNFKKKISSSVVKKELRLILSDKENQVINSLKLSYKYSYSNKFLNKFKNKFSSIRLIGMGGSILGTKAIYSFLNSQIKKKIFFFDNLLPLLKKEKKSNFLNIIISKSGNTLETISNTNNIVKKSQRNIFITENSNNYLRNLANQLKAEIVDHNNFIGGRYSVLSEVGMLPCSLIGLKSNKFKQFNSLIKKKGFIDSLVSNVANILYFIKKKKNNSIILNYDENSDDLFRWYQQLVGESLGKKQKGIFPFISTMPKDNHSLMQLYLDGPQKNFFTFFGVSEKKSNKIINSTILETFSFIKNKKFSQILDSQRIATQKVFNNMNIPFRSFEIKKRNEETLGELFTFFILETILLGKCLKINPYDQPAVELIKKSTKKTLLNF